jgi:hypothetical protein
MNKKDTQHYHTIGGMEVCSYCHNDVMPYDIFDDYNNWLGSYYQCNCEQAKIEYQMNEEIEVLEKQIEEIRDKYKDKLKIDEKTINRMQFECEVENLKEMYGIDQSDERNDL